MIEQWRVIPHMPEYEISENGVVRRSATGKIFAHGKDQKGYYRVPLYINGVRRTFKIHRLVASTFIGECPSGYQVNHIDGVKTNNHYTNLEYVTGSQNMKHAVALGLVISPGKPGELHAQAILSDNDVIEIKRLLLHSDMSQTAIARRYNVHNSTIHLIAKGRNWPHLTIDGTPLNYPLRAGRPGRPEWRVKGLTS